VSVAQASGDAGLTGVCSAACTTDSECAAVTDMVPGAEVFETRCLGLHPDGTVGVDATSRVCFHTVPSGYSFCTTRSLPVPVTYDGTTLYVCLPEFN